MKKTKAISIRVPSDIFEELERARKESKTTITAEIVGKLRQETNFKYLSTDLARKVQGVHDQSWSKAVTSINILTKSHKNLLQQLADLRTDLRKLTHAVAQQSKIIDQQIEEPLNLSSKIKNLFRSRSK